MRVLVVYCLNGSLTWVYRKSNLSTYDFACVEDSFKITRHIQTIADAQAVRAGILAHSVNLRGAFQRAEHWLDLT